MIAEYRKRPTSHLRAFNVYVRGVEIDTVFYAATDAVTAQEVRRSLIDHDGYPDTITVREERR